MDSINIEDTINVNVSNKQIQIKNMDIEISGISICKECIYDDINCFRDGKDCQMQAIETVLNLLEKKDERISDLEYALIDMVMQFADRPKIKDYHYALSTMGLSALETAFAELDFDDPMPVAEAEKKYKVLVDKYYERKVENGN